MPQLTLHWDIKKSFGNVADDNCGTVVDGGVDGGGHCGDLPPLRPGQVENISLSLLYCGDLPSLRPGWVKMRRSNAYKTSLNPIETMNMLHL